MDNLKYTKKELSLESNRDLFGNDISVEHTLSDKYVQPPFSVLNSQKGDWRSRKDRWINLGIKSEVGREVGLLGLQAFNDSDKYVTSKSHVGTSVFDPVLTELMYRWFGVKGGSVIDPFAGGSVRGIVANYLGYKYTGIELRGEQVESNREQAIDILDVNNQPQWYCGDSDVVLESLSKNNKYDFLFSCPPYLDLEVYSELPQDLSNMSFDNFKKKYFSIISKSCRVLTEDALAVFVVGDVRCPKGYYRDFITMTKQAFYDSGMKLYNELIYIESSYFSAGMRANKYMKSSRKIPKVHQNVLVFKK